MIEESKPNLQEVSRHLARALPEYKPESEEAGIRRSVVRFGVWEGRPFRRQWTRMLTMALQCERTKGFYSLYRKLYQCWFKAIRKSEQSKPGTFATRRFFGVYTLRAKKANDLQHKVTQCSLKDEFSEIEDGGLAVFGTVFTATKWLPFKPKLYGPFIVGKAGHPRYKSKLDSSRQ